MRALRVSALPKTHTHTHWVLAPPSSSLSLPQPATAEGLQKDPRRCPPAVVPAPGGGERKEEDQVARRRYGDLVDVGIKTLSARLDLLKYVTTGHCAATEVWPLRLIPKNVGPAQGWTWPRQIFDSHRTEVERSAYRGLNSGTVYKPRLMQFRILRDTIGLVVKSSPTPNTLDFGEAEGRSRRREFDLLVMVFCSLRRLNFSPDKNTLACRRRVHEETFLVLLWVSWRVGQGNLLLVPLFLLPLGDLRRRWRSHGGQELWSDHEPRTQQLGGGSHETSNVRPPTQRRTPLTTVVVPVLSLPRAACRAVGSARLC